MRPDLLALTSDDLMLLANRGLVKRAQQELQAGQLQVEIEENANTITARWSDDVTCVLPGGKPANAGRCTCPATTVCRHLLRSILAYQQHVATQASAPAPAPAQPWDPGMIGDDLLAQYVSASARAWARQAFADGQVIELVRGAKPSAYLHSLACSLRFLVPGDPRYTHCDCAEPAPCRHVPLAVWAFRALAAEQPGGVIESAATAPAVPTTLLDDLDQVLRELVAAGVSGAPHALIERLRRLDSRLRAAGLVWPADALAEITQQHAAYAAHDARFEPPLLARLLGELCVRADAIRTNTGAVPQLFVRGAFADRETTVGTARLIGLGCGVRVRRGGVELAAYLQDAGSGGLLAVRRDSGDPQEPSATLAPFWRLAEGQVAKATTLAAFASGQVLVKGGRRLPNGTFLPGRAQLAFNPQAYAWESLRAPVLAEDFNELAARIAAQPPSALRPRRITDALYVCAVDAVAQASFVPAEQLVRAVLKDSAGEQALLQHPYTARGQQGVTALLDALRNQPGELRFVAGHVQMSPRGLLIAPVALVFQNNATRTALLPWIAREQADQPVLHFEPLVATTAQIDPLAAYWTEIADALGDLLVTGLQRADERTARHWHELASHGGALGFGQVLQPIERLAELLANKSHTLRWDAAPAAATLLELASLTLLAGEMIAVE